MVWIGLLVTLLVQMPKYNSQIIKQNIPRGWPVDTQTPGKNKTKKTLFNSQPLDHEIMNWIRTVRQTRAKPEHVQLKCCISGFMPGRAGLFRARSMWKHSPSARRTNPEWFSQMAQTAQADLKQRVTDTSWLLGSFFRLGRVTLPLRSVPPCHSPWGP